MTDRKQIYFVSDLHLGMHPPVESLERERLFVQWLEQIRGTVSELWLLGDLFDYWFEYWKVVPRGFTRCLGKLASLHDDGVKIHLIPGNHDIWVFNYLPAEIGLEVHRESVKRTWNGHTFHLDHGDGLDGKDRLYNLLQGIFRNRLLQWLYARIHPNASTAFAQWWSRRSRMKNGAFLPFLGAEKEHQVLFARQELQIHPEIEYFVFGHRHVPFDIRIGEKSRVIGLGDWIENFTYAVFDGETLHLRKYLDGRGEIITIP